MRAHTFARRIEAIPVWRVLTTFVVLQWVLVLGIALAVRHNGWIYYQGGDQIWYYVTGWMLGHGQFPPPGIGFLWGTLLAPVALFTGPNAANAYPAVIALQFLFLLPIAPLAMYGIGARIGGRLFGYWTAALWLLVPLIGIKFTDAGYHERFTEVLLPQAFGLTGMADFPTMLAALVSAYYCVRVLADEQSTTLDAIAAGVAAGAAIAIKPATALCLCGPVLGFVVARRGRACLLFGAGLAPAVLALAFVKWRGFGYLPLFHAAGAVPLADGATGHQVGTFAGVGHYLPFDWHQFVVQLDQLREHFWSGRLLEWLVVAGLIAVFIRSRPYGALILGWFLPIVLIKTASARADLEGGGLLRVLMPAYPAFVVMLAALVFLPPGVTRRVPVVRFERRMLAPRNRVAVLCASVLVTAVVPVAAYAVASPARPGPGLRVGFLGNTPLALGVDLGLTAQTRPHSVALQWQQQRPAGGHVFYHVFRRPAAGEFCFIPTGDQPKPGSAYHCTLVLTDLGQARAPSFVDRAPPSGTNVYYVGVAANWLNDTAQGDVYTLSRGVSAGS